MTSAEFLYIHIPFCDTKCFYCSFVVSVGQKHRVDLYLQMLEREARLYSKTSIEGVYIGGGTPSFLDDRQLDNLVRIINENFNIRENAEWTIEINPETINLAKAKLLKRLGINRASLGVQSLNDNYLKYLGRNHDAQRAISAYQTVKDAGFDNVSVDLMYSFPQQTIAELKTDIDRMCRLNSDHISIYTLTIEENSRFFAKQVSLDGQDILVEQHTLVEQCLKERGFYQYEVSNFAKKNKESIHNMNYWLCGNYIGLGVGAHSHRDGLRSWNVSKLNEYIKRFQDGLSAKAGQEELTQQARFMEAVLFGLRMNQGIDLGSIEKRFGCPMPQEKRELLDRWAIEGFVTRDKDRWKATDRGRLVLDDLSAKLI